MCYIQTRIKPELQAHTSLQRQILNALLVTSRLVLDIDRQSTTGLFGSALFTQAAQERAAPSFSHSEISTQNFCNTKN